MALERHKCNPFADVWKCDTHTISTFNLAHHHPQLSPTDPRSHHSFSRPSSLGLSSTPILSTASSTALSTAAPTAPSSSFSSVLSPILSSADLSSLSRRLTGVSVTSSASSICVFVRAIWSAIWDSWDGVRRYGRQYIFGSDLVWRWWAWLRRFSLCSRSYELVIPTSQTPKPLQEYIHMSVTRGAIPSPHSVS